MKALAITDDHKRQEEAYFSAPDYLRGPRDLRRLLMEGRIGSEDKFVRFVGIAAYEAAGGAVTRDLFSGDPSSDGDGVYIEDSGLLHRLANAKLEEEAARLRDQGWKWVEIDPDLTQSDHYKLPRISLSVHGFELDSATARLYAGVILGVGSDGEVKALTGVLKPEDAKSLKRARASNGAGAKAGEAAASASSPKVGTAGLSAPLVEELTAQRTAALQAVVAKRPEVALALIVHDLALGVFYEPWDGDRKLTGLAPKVTDVAPLLAAGEASTALAETKATMGVWRGRLPEKAFDLWTWVVAQDRSTLLDLLAVALATNVNAIQHRHEKTVPARITASNRLAQAVALDMRDWWQADAAFLSRLPKAAILAAISEAVSPEVAAGLDRAAKAELVMVAERKLAGTGWLPEPLRAVPAPDYDEADELNDVEETEGEAMVDHQLAG